MTKVPSYVVKARAYLRRTMIRETPHLAELARLQRALERAAAEHGIIAFAAAAQTLALAIEAEVDGHDGVLVTVDSDALCTAAAEATPPLFPEA